MFGLLLSTAEKVAVRQLPFGYAFSGWHPETVLYSGPAKLCQSSSSLSEGWSVKLTVGVMIMRSVPDNIMSTIRSQLVLTVHLRPSTVLCRAPCPNVDMVDPILPIIYAFGAGIFKAKILLRVRVPDNLALGKLAGRSSHGARVSICSLASSNITAPAIVRNRCKNR